MATFGASGLSWTRVRTPRRLSTAFKIIYVLSGAGSGVITSLSNYGTPVMLLMAAFSILSLLSWGLLVASYILSLTQSWQTGNVEVNETHLDVQAIGKPLRRVPRSEIAGALVVPRNVGGGWIVNTVELELTSGDRLTVRLAEPEAAGALVAELGFGPGRRRVRSRLAKPSRRAFHLAVGAALYILFLAPIMAISVLMATTDTNMTSINLMRGLAAGGGQLLQMLVYTLITRLMRPSEAVIGDDGVSIQRAGGGRSKFYRANDPQLRGALAGLNVDAERVDAVVREVFERTAVGSHAEPTLFARGGRSMSEWRAHLAMTMDQSNYRANAKTADDAAAVLRNANASADERVGAAIALRAVGEPAERVRIAAEGMADEHVRVALEAVADGADDLVMDRTLARAVAATRS